MDLIEFNLPMIEDGEDKSSPFKNCIRKNYKHIRKWAKRTHTNCFRIYDREMHHYPLAIDFYAGKYCVHYFSPRGDLQEPEDAFVEDVENTLHSLLNVKEKIFTGEIALKEKNMNNMKKKIPVKIVFMFTSMVLNLKLI